MKNIEIYDSEFFKLPKKQNTEEFYEFVSNTLDEYLQQLDKFEGNLKSNIENNKENIFNLCHSIKKAIEHYLNGHTFKAYNVLEAGLNRIHHYLKYPKNNKIIVPSLNSESFYKLRYSRSRLKHVEDLFHVPFQLRFKIQSSRYSIPGVPCLYLANSLALCWEELRKPNIDFLYGCRYELNLNEFSFLNLALTPQTISYINKNLLKFNTTYNSDYFLLEEAIITWPLSFVCSLPTLRHDASFKVEYIIPQLVTQWIQANTDLDGLMYFSTIIDYPEIDGCVPFHINLAIPIKTNSKKGFCQQLSKKVKLTEPVCIGNYKHLRKKQPKKSELNDWLKKSRDSFNNYIFRSSLLGKDMLLLFDKVEIELLKKDLKKIESA